MIMKLIGLFFAPEACKASRLYKGKYYALPINLETQVLCYNTNKVKHPPKTLDDLVIQARQGYSVGSAFQLSSIFMGHPSIWWRNFQRSRDNLL